MKASNVTISLKTGHLMRQSEAIAECAALFAKRMAEIPYKYCEDDGSELVVKRETENDTVMMVCPNCDYGIFVPKDKVSI